MRKAEPCIDFQIMISGQARGKQAYCRKSMTDNAARIFNLDVYNEGAEG